jgi:hypothetical protein
MNVPEFGKNKDLNRTGASFANASNGTGTPLDNMYQSQLGEAGGRTGFKDLAPLARKTVTKKATQVLLTT